MIKLPMKVHFSLILNETESQSFEARKETIIIFVTTYNFNNGSIYYNENVFSAMKVNKVYNYAKQMERKQMAENAKLKMKMYIFVILTRLKLQSI